MNSLPTIPCPICQAPIHIQNIRLSESTYTSVYADPMLSDERSITMHEHQQKNLVEKLLH